MIFNQGNYGKQQNMANFCLLNGRNAPRQATSDICPLCQYAVSLNGKLVSLADLLLLDRCANDDGKTKFVKVHCACHFAFSCEWYNYVVWRLRRTGFG